MVYIVDLGRLQTTECPRTGLYIASPHTDPSDPFPTCLIIAEEKSRESGQSGRGEDDPDVTSHELTNAVVSNYPPMTSTGGASRLAIPAYYGKPRSRACRWNNIPF